jgi:hypothetical protein
MSQSVPGSPSHHRPLLRRRGDGWWRRLSPLGRDIVVILVIKFAALALLWWVFFSHPTAPHMRVETSRIDARILASDSLQEAPRAVR